MSILSGSAIISAVESGDIILNPFLPENVNPNSYNYRLSHYLMQQCDEADKQFQRIDLSQEGFILKPQTLYLAATQEIIGSTKYAMSLIGRSSIGRLGLFLQVSANLGHTGSNHKWTLELVAARPIKIYPGMIIGQVSFWENVSSPPIYKGFYGDFSEAKESQEHLI